MKVYFDGKIAFERVDGEQNQFNDNSWIPVPHKATVLAIRCKHRGGENGMVASTTDGSIVTNKNWRCSSKYKSGWAKPGFKDRDGVFSKAVDSILFTSR